MGQTKFCRSKGLYCWLIFDLGLWIPEESRMVELGGRSYKFLSSFFWEKNLKEKTFLLQSSLHTWDYWTIHIFFVECLPLLLDCEGCKNRGQMCLVHTVPSAMVAQCPVNHLHVVIADKLRDTTEQGTREPGPRRERELGEDLTSLIYFPCHLGQVPSSVPSSVPGL